MLDMVNFAYISRKQRDFMTIIVCILYIFSVIKKNIKKYIFTIHTVHISIMQNLEKSNGMEARKGPCYVDMVQLFFPQWFNFKMQFW